MFRALKFFSCISNAAIFRGTPHNNPLKKCLELYVVYGIAFKKSFIMNLRITWKCKKKMQTTFFRMYPCAAIPFSFLKVKQCRRKKPVKISHYVVLHIMKATSDMTDVISQVAAEVWRKRCISEKFYCFAVYSVSWNVNKL